MHIKEKELEFKEEDFPIRVRQAAQCLEYFVNDIMTKQVNKRNLQKCFDDSTESIIKELTIKSKRFLNGFTNVEYYSNIYNSYLLEYMICHKYREIYGSSFYVPVQSFAAHFLTSGIACPVGTTIFEDPSNVEFKTVDVIGFKLAKELLKITSIPKIEDMDMAVYIGQHADDRTTFEKAYSIALSIVKAKFSELFSLNSTINPTLKQKLNKAYFSCNKVCTCNGFKEYCLQQKWISTCEEKTGEELYFDYSINYCEHIVNILYRPTNVAHIDAIIALPDTTNQKSKSTKPNNQVIFISFSFQCLTGKKSESLLELMLVDKYQDINLQRLSEYVNQQHDKDQTNVYDLPYGQWWSSLRKQFIELYQNRTVSVILHPSLSLKKTSKGNYHNSIFITSIEDVATLFGKKFASCVEAFLKLEK